MSQRKKMALRGEASSGSFPLKLLKSPFSWPKGVAFLWNSSVCVMGDVPLRREDTGKAIFEFQQPGLPEAAARAALSVIGRSGWGLGCIKADTVQAIGFYWVVVSLNKGTIRWESPVLTGLWNFPGLGWGWSNLLLESSVHSNSSEEHLCCFGRSS